MVVKNPSAIARDARDTDLISGPGRSPGVRKGNPLQPVKSPGQMSLADYLQSPGHKESDTTERLSTHTHYQFRLLAAIVLSETIFVALHKVRETYFSAPITILQLEDITKWFFLILKMGGDFGGSSLWYRYCVQMFSGPASLVGI